MWGSDRDATSTTVVWPRSHAAAWPAAMDDAAARALGAIGVHYLELRELGDAARRDALLATFRDRARRARVPAGALLVWNSRTVHQGWAGGPRLAQTVCFEPIARRGADARARKLRLCALGLPSTHWASLGEQHDMTIGAEHERAALAARGGATHDEVVLPLKAVARAAPLAAAHAGDAVSPDACYDERGEIAVAALEGLVREEYREWL